MGGSNIFVWICDNRPVIVIFSMLQFNIIAPSVTAMLLCLSELPALFVIVRLLTTMVFAVGVPL